MALAILNVQFIHGDRDVTSRKNAGSRFRRDFDMRIIRSLALVVAMFTLTFPAPAVGGAQGIGDIRTRAVSGGGPSTDGHLSSLANRAEAKRGNEARIVASLSLREGEQAMTPGVPSVPQDVAHSLRAASVELYTHVAAGSAPDPTAQPLATNRVNPSSGYYHPARYALRREPSVRIATSQFAPVF